MIKFEKHEGKLFRMLDEPVPMKENDENVLVRFITHGVIGEYVIEHCLDCNQKNVPIFVDSVDSDGDVTACIENGNEYICCPFPMFEIIGYPVEEGSGDWALYQMMQGKKVSYKDAIGNVCWALNQDGDVQYYDMDDLSYIGTIRSKLEFGKNHAFKTVWQLYKEPEQPKSKPETLFDTWQCPVCGESISAEFEDSGHPRYNEEHLDENLCFAIGDHMKYSHTVEQPKYKVGDWVEWCGDQYMVESAPPQSGGRYDIRSPYDELGWSVCPENITRKLSPADIVIRIGCLSGTIGKSCDLDRFLMWHSSPKIDFDYSIIKFSAIDKETRKFVESLLKAQEEEK